MQHEEIEKMLIGIIGKNCYKKKRKKKEKKTKEVNKREIYKSDQIRYD